MSNPLRWLPTGAVFPSLIDPGVSTAPRARLSRTAALAVMLLLVLGLGLRGWLSLYAKGIVHADEHQQYMEQANRLAFGYGMTFWEQERGMRSYLFPGFLAAQLLGLDACGLTDPVLQAAALRLILSLAAFAAMIAIAWRLDQLGNRPAALFFVAWSSLSLFLVFITTRTLSDTAIIAPFLLALLCLNRCPFAAGILLGIAFAIRFQTAFLIASVVGCILLESARTKEPFSRSPAAFLLGGLGLALLAAGFLDRITLGSWFHSPVEYVRANLLENQSARYGIEPWYFYLAHAAAWLWAFPLIAPYLLLGCLREWRLALVALLFLGAHSAVGHKEERFIWCLVPIAFLLGAAGFQVVWNRLRKPFWKTMVVVATVLCLIWGEWTLVRQLPWNGEPFTSSALALCQLGQREDVTGVAVYGVWRSACGNYFYLRRPVPLCVEPARNLASLESQLQAVRAINYLLTYPDLCRRFRTWQPTEIGRAGALVIYKLNR
jgi:phosphatidylinositol glycan class B